MNMKHLIQYKLLILISIFFAACSASKTIPYNARWNAPFSFVDEVKPDQEDQKSRLKYGIINDQEYVYMTFKTRDPNTIQKILSNGVTLQFAPEGEKNNAYALQFPVLTKEDRKALRQIDIDMPNSLGLKLLLDSYNKEALWKDKSGSHSLNLVIPDGSIKANISLDHLGELTEQISIPLSLLGINLQESNRLGLNIKIEGASAQSGGGLSPRIGVGLGGGIGMGGVGIGLGSGNRYGNGSADKGVDIKLEVLLSKN